MIGKFVTKIIQSLPTWEITKYYGRVCIYQFKCLKYKVQTSEAWFNFKCKFMPGSFHNELECKEVTEPKTKNNRLKQKAKHICLETETSKKKEFTAKKTESQYLSSFPTEQKYQEEYTKKKQRKMKHTQ